MAMRQAFVNQSTLLSLHEHPGDEGTVEKPQRPQQSQQTAATRTLFIFRKEHVVRNACDAALESMWFTGFIMATVVVSCVALALQPPSRDQDLSDIPLAALDTINLVTTAVFTLEFIMQVSTHARASMWLPQLEVMMQVTVSLPRRL